MNSGLKLAIENILRTDAELVKKLPHSERLLCEQIKTSGNNSPQGHRALPAQIPLRKSSFCFQAKKGSVLFNSSEKGIIK